MSNLKKTYTLEVEGQQAMKGVYALREEFKQLDKELENVAAGSAEASAILRRMGEIKGDIKALNEEVQNLDPGEKINAFINLSGAATGAFGIATVAAKNFGLGSEESLGKMEEKLLSVITVLQSLEAIRAATESQHLTAIKNMLGLGNAYTVAGIKAKLFGTTARAALTATGIGALLVLVGLLISNWESITGAVGRFKDKIADTFPGVIKFVDTFIDRLRDVASFLSFGLIDDAATAAQKKAESAEAKMLEGKIANRKRLIAEEAAAGRSVYNLKQQQLADELKLLELHGKKETEEYRDKLSEIFQLKNSHDKSLSDRDTAAAKKAEDKRKEEAKKYKEQTAKEAEEAYNAMRKAEADEYAAREEARNKRYNMAKALGARDAVLLQIELDNLTDKQQDLLDQGKRFSAEWYDVEAQKLEKTKAIHAAEKAEDDKRLAEKERVYQQELETMDAEYQKQRVLLIKRNGTLEEFDKLELSHLKTKQIALATAGKEYTKEYEAILIAINELEGKLLAKRESLLDRFLKKLFVGLDSDTLDEFKQGLQRNLEVLYSSLLSISDNLVEAASKRLDAQMDYVDNRLDELKEKNDITEGKLNESIKKSEELTKQLDGSRGSRREYLIKQISRERQEEAKLIAAKKAAANEEKKLAAQKEQIEKKRQELEAKARISQEASILVNQASTAADIIATNIRAAKSAAGLPFPLSLAAIAASVSAVAAVVMSGRKLAATIKSSKFQQGGYVEGPSHEEGGIPFTVKGKAGFEMEGGEYIVNKQSTKAFFPVLEAINKVSNIQVARYPNGKYARGGDVPLLNGEQQKQPQQQTGGAYVANEDLAAIKALLSSIDANTLKTSEKKFSLSIDPWGAKKLKDMAEGVEKDEQAGKVW